MNKAFKIVLVLAILAVFAGTIYFLYQKSVEKPVEYQTETAFVTDIIRKTVANGSVIPRKEVDIKPQVSGIIEKLYIEPGQQVKEGDILARIRIIPNMANLVNAENRLNRARLSLQQAERDFGRAKELFRDKVISASEYESAETAFKNAREELNAADNNMQLIRSGSTRSQGGNTIVKATIPGMVLNVPVKEGNLVIESSTFSDGTTIATIADMNNMIFEGKVDESEVGKLQTGMDLILTIGAISDQRFNAKLEYISPKGKEEQGAIQFEIRAALEVDTSSFIRAGYSANADIVLDRKDSVLAIMEGLLIFDNSKTYVEVETAPQVFERREVKTGISDGLNIEILSGLENGVKVKNPNAMIR